MASFLAVGCHRGEHHDHGPEHGHAHERKAQHGHSHGDDAQSFSGASHKEGIGITLLPQTREVLGIQTAEVEERRMARSVRWLARVYDLRSTGLLAVQTATPAGAVASGVIAARDALDLKAGMAVQALTDRGEKLSGRIVSVGKSVSASEKEIVTRLEGVGAGLPVGTFLSAEILVPSERPVAVVPKEAVVRAADTNHVYLVNGEAYLRTSVETGIESESFIEIRDGVLMGDSVVTRGALDLRLIELRAVKGGQGCCPAPPARGKK